MQTNILKDLCQHPRTARELEHAVAQLQRWGQSEGIAIIGGVPYRICLRPGLSVTLMR